MRVHELAKRLGWSSSQLIAVLKDRGEYVKSAMSKIEPPVVRDILREFSAEIVTPTEELTDNVIHPGIYGRSVGTSRVVEGGLSFGAELARIKAEPPRPNTKAKQQDSWLPPILKALLDEIIVPARPQHLGAPDGPYCSWEIKKAKALHQQWAAARLNGLAGDDSTIIKWIRLSGDGQRPQRAADLYLAGITVDEAALRLTYGRPDPRRDTIFQIFRDGRITTTEAWPRCISGGAISTPDRQADHHGVHIGQFGWLKLTVPVQEWSVLPHTLTKPKTAATKLGDQCAAIHDHNSRTLVAGVGATRPSGYRRLVDVDCHLECLPCWERIWEQNRVKLSRTSATACNRLDRLKALDLHISDRSRSERPRPVRS